MHMLVSVPPHVSCARVLARARSLSPSVLSLTHFLSRSRSRSLYFSLSLSLSLTLSSLLSLSLSLTLTLSLSLSLSLSFSLSIYLSIYLCSSDTGLRVRCIAEEEETGKETGVSSTEDQPRGDCMHAHLYHQSSQHFISDNFSNTHPPHVQKHTHTLTHSCKQINVHIIYVYIYIYICSHTHRERCGGRFSNDFGVL
jgi:hypothetical protein